MSWNWVKIKEIKSKEKYSLVGGPFGSDLSGKHYVNDGGVPVIRGGNLPFGKKFDTTDFVFVSTKKANSLKSNTAYPGDIVFTQRGTLGQVGIVPNDYERYIVSQSQMKLKVNEEKVSALFVYYYFRTEEAVIRIENVAMSSGIPHTNLGILQNFKIPLPSLFIQKRITSILTAYDDLIENNNQRIKLLEEMAAEIYKEWFVRFRFPGYKEAVFLDKEGMQVAHGTKGAIPEGWERKLVRDIVKRYNAGKKYDNKTALEKGNVPILDQGQSGVIGFHNDEPGVLASMDNPIIVFANHTCYQNLIQYNFSAIQNILPFKSNVEYKRNLFWLHYATKDLIVFNDYKGHWPEFSTKKTLVPNKNIDEKFGVLIKPMINEIELLKNKNKILQETRDLLLPRLISGKLSVEDLEIEEMNIAAEPQEKYSK
jgi:type I restriction enzyme S subunit